MIPNICRYEAERLWEIVELKPKQRMRALNRILRQVRQADKQSVKKVNISCRV